MLDKEGIFERQRVGQVQEVRIEALDDEVRVKKLSAKAVMAATKATNGDARLIAASLVDEDDERIMTAQEAEKLNADVFAELGRKIGDINGWNTDADEIEGN